MNISSKFIFGALLTLTLFACSEKDSIYSDDENQLQIAKINEIAQDLEVEITVDNSINESNSIVINSEEEYRNFISKVKSSSNNATKISLKNTGPQINTFNLDCQDGVYDKRVLTSGFADLILGIVVMDGCIQEVDAGFYGWTLGVSFDKTESHIDCKEAVVCGKINYNLFFQGVGTIYTERVCYTITLNC